MRCEDCGGLIGCTVAENAAVASGARLCIGCIESIEADALAYDEMDEAEGRPPCDWFERQLARHVIEPAAPLPSAGGER